MGSNGKLIKEREIRLVNQSLEGHFTHTVFMYLHGNEHNTCPFISLCAVFKEICSSDWVLFILCNFNDLFMD